MGEDFVDAYLSARTMRATEDVANELRKMRQGTVPLDQYNKLVVEYNCDIANFAAQRDEAIEIFKENQSILPFTPEEARARMRAKGFEAEEAEKQRMDNKK